MSEPFKWVVVKDREQLEAFYRSILPKVTVAARAEGYAIGIHGSLRRDLDLIAVPWTDHCSTKDQLASAIHRAACGIEMQTYQWERKPHRRMATCFPVCFPEFSPHCSELSLGHIDLSVSADIKNEPLNYIAEAKLGPRLSDQLAASEEDSNGKG